MEWSHPGLSRYLVDRGQTVINISTPYGSNLDAITRLQGFLLHSPDISSKISKILFFQTEWHRDWLDYQPMHAIKDREEPATLGYRVTQTQWIESLYQKIDSVSREYRLPIYLIGGAGDVHMDLTKKYPGIGVACQSMVQLLVSGDPAPQRLALSLGETMPLDLLEKLKSHGNTDDLQYLLDDISSANQRLALLRSRSDLFPDGWHAGRLGHLKLLEHLDQTLSW